MASVMANRLVEVNPSETSSRSFETTSSEHEPRTACCRYPRGMHKAPSLPIAVSSSARGAGTAAPSSGNESDSAPGTPRNGAANPHPAEARTRRNGTGTNRPNENHPDEEGDEGVRRDSPPPPPTGPDGSAPADNPTNRKWLACQFLLRDPHEHIACLFYHPRGPSDLRQHLKRVHLKGLQCSNCGEEFTGDDDEEKLQKHVFTGGCARKAFCRPRLTMNGDQFLQMQPTSRAPTSDTAKADVWYGMWAILFGDDAPPPSSPWLETKWGFCEVLKYQLECANRGSLDDENKAHLYQVLDTVAPSFGAVNPGLAVTFDAAQLMFPPMLAADPYDYDYLLDPRLQGGGGAPGFLDFPGADAVDHPIP